METKFKVDVIQDDEGTWGVEIMDDDGGGYRFKRGKEDSVNATKKEAYGSKGMLRERFDQTSGKLYIGSFKPAGADRQRDEACEAAA